MKYRVEISSIAESEADTAFLRLSQLTSPAQASKWYGGLLEAINSLSAMPKRCPLARENEHFMHRILFTILENEETSTVRILHIRYSSQQAIGEDSNDSDSS